MKNLIDVIVVQVSSKGKLIDLYAVLKEDEIILTVDSKKLQELRKELRA